MARAIPDRFSRYVVIDGGDPNPAYAFRDEEFHNLTKNHQPPPADSGLQKASLLGGYHSRGVPGEKGWERQVAGQVVSRSVGTCCG